MAELGMSSAKAGPSSSSGVMGGSACLAMSAVAPQVTSTPHTMERSFQKFLMLRVTGGC